MVLGGVLYTVCITAQTLGFGVDAAGVRAFAGSSAPLNDLGNAYVGSGMAELLDAGAMLSAFGAALGGVAVGSRMLFALSRDGLLARAVSRASPRTRARRRPALAAIMVLALVALLAFGIAGTHPLDAFFYLATTGVLSLLVMYIVTDVGAIRVALGDGPGARMVGRDPPRLRDRGGRLHALQHLSPVPDVALRPVPYIVAAWLAVGLVVTFLVPGFSERVAAQLAAAPASEQPELARAVNRL